MKKSNELAKSSSHGNESAKPKDDDFLERVAERRRTTAGSLRVAQLALNSPTPCWGPGPMRHGSPTLCGRNATAHGLCPAHIAQRKKGAELRPVRSYQSMERLRRMRAAQNRLNARGYGFLFGGQ